MKSIKILAILLCFGMLLSTSCKKDSNTEGVTKSDALNAAQDNSISNDVYGDVYIEADDVINTEESNSYTSASQLKSGTLKSSRNINVVQNNDTTYTVTVTYDNWTGRNGRVKNGELTIVQAGRMWHYGATRTITLNGFTINDSLLVEGTKTITNLGWMGNDLTLQVILEDGKITNLNTDKFITRAFSRMLTWKRGDNLLSVLDDSYIVRGTASGTTRNGFSYTAEIDDSNPLVLTAICPWITSGKLTLMVNKTKTVTIDYGDGTCDRKFEITIDGEVIEVDSFSGSPTT